MLEKPITFFLSKRKLIIHFILITLYRLRILPAKYNQKARSLIKLKEIEGTFKNLRLQSNDLGFHHLDPMPSKTLLKSFYEEAYWQNRDQNMYPVKNRDLEHYKLLEELFPNFNKSSRRILNFGSGHGGISVLLHLKNHIIENFDYYKQKQIFETKWKNLTDLKKIDGKYDLIYSSHSLEHVENLNEIMLLFKEVSHKDTIFFFEVPNCHQKQFLKVSPPHTYYFSIFFFRNVFEKIFFSKSYNGTSNGLIALENIKEGNTLRVVASNIADIKNIN